MKKTASEIRFKREKQKALRNIGEAWRLIEESKLLLRRRAREART